MAGEKVTSTLAQSEIKKKDNMKLPPLATRCMLSMRLGKEEKKGLGHWKSPSLLPVPSASPDWWLPGVSSFLSCYQKRQRHNPQRAIHDVL